MRHVILGTAGHIDHGKSSLVKALTGTDPDRLKEEKERGITIDIGFADLEYPEDGLSVGIVDVPGHERLIRNMLAGAGGIDIVLLVIAADEGIMPQSREHLSICNLLGIRSGIITVTKSDLVDAEWLTLVTEDIRAFVKGTFLESAPLVSVSSRTGANLESLKQEIRKCALSVTPKSAGGLFRLPIDRVFTLKGFGTVITGTAVSGMIRIDDPIEILPSAIRTKVRGLHSHGRAITEAAAGQRVAINLQGVEKEELSRGDVAVAPDVFAATRVVDVYLELLGDAPPLKNRSLLHLYSGTAESVARIIMYDRTELKGGDFLYCRLRLATPIVLLAGDRYIVRRFSPLETLGGGMIIDPSPIRRSRTKGIEDLGVLHTGTLDQKIALKVQQGGTRGNAVQNILGWINEDRATIQNSIRHLEQAGTIVRCEDRLLHTIALGDLGSSIIRLVKAYHGNNPLKPGIPKEELRTGLGLDAQLFGFVLSRISGVVTDQNIVRLKEFRIALSGKEEEGREKLLKILEDAGFQPPSKEEIGTALKIDQKRLGDILGMLVKEGVIVRMSSSLYVSGAVYRRMTELLKKFFSTKSEMSVADFRDLLGTSRKYALPYLEYLDANKITIRTGDVRKLLLKN